LRHIEDTAMGNRDKQGREKKKPKKEVPKVPATRNTVWTPTYKPTPTPPPSSDSSS
jgi:hypothetical protein